MHIIAQSFYVSKEDMPLFRARVDDLLHRMPPVSFDEAVAQVGWMFLYGKIRGEIIGIASTGEVEESHLSFLQQLAPLFSLPQYVTLEDNSGALTQVWIQHGEYKYRSL